MDHLPLAVRTYLIALCDALVVALGKDQVLQLFVIGSASYPSGYVSGQSDLDVAVVTRTRLEQPVLRRVVENCSQSVLPCPAEKLELVVYAYEDVHLAEPELPYNISLNFNTGRTLPHDHVRYGNNPDDSPHWFILDIAAAHANNVPLLPAGGTFAEIFTPQLRRLQVLEALQTSLQWHIDNEATSANAVLNACRGLRWVDEGVFGSKLDGGKYILGLSEPKMDEQATQAVYIAMAARDGTGSQYMMDGAAAESLYAAIAHKLQLAMDAETRV